MTSLKKIRRRARAIHRRTPAKCILCGAEREYDPIAGWYTRLDGESGCGKQFETGSVFCILDNGRRSHRLAGSSIATASSA